MLELTLKMRRLQRQRGAECHIRSLTAGSPAGGVPANVWFQQQVHITAAPDHSHNQVKWQCSYRSHKENFHLGRSLFWTE